MLLPLLVLLTWFETQADVAEFLESLHTRGCSLPEVHCEGGLPTELRLDVEKLRQRDSMLRDDAVISALSAWQKVPTLKLLKINGLTGGKVPSEICKLLQLESLGIAHFGIQRLNKLRRLNLVANKLHGCTATDSFIQSELYTSLPKTRFGMTIFPDTRHVAEPSAREPRAFTAFQQRPVLKQPRVIFGWAKVPLCSHSMADAERFKTTNNMYSVFSVPDHQNAQARCWAANEAAQQYDEMKVARKAGR
eukprot:Skav218799  [mRNA]  locus=scaffold1140:269202:273533:+ [translate_table: standard]